MGLLESFEWMNSYSKKQCKSVFWRVRAAVKRAMKKNKHGGKQHCKFQYDPSSYALNFDDGCYNLDFGANAVKFQDYESETKKIMWVCVLWVDDSQ